MSSQPSWHAVLLDLGGVVLDVHYERSLEALERLGFHDIRYWYSGYAQKGFFEDFEEGRLSPEDFLKELGKHCPEAAETQLIQAWNAMLGRVTPQRVKFLKRLAARWPLYLFSNTNALHQPFFERQFEEDHGFKINKLFKKIFYSHQVGLRKPRPEAFLKVAEEAGLTPSRTLFVDDNPENVAGAQTAGFIVRHLQYPR
ncbi:MAG: HAD family phosphatase, partial [Flavobacteriales bacterium]|nr:HAD family phosphatase [Flavobacteriales bacterium]MDW8409811.1 HAD family phosphatase [Flavobacteriales bacterium]